MFAFVSPHPITTAAFVFVSIKSQTPSSDQMLLLGVLGEAWRRAPLIPASGSRGRRSSGLERVPGLQREALTVKGERSGENVSVSEIWVLPSPVTPFIDR